MPDHAPDCSCTECQLRRAVERLTAERDEARGQLTELKRGLVHNNTDFQLAFLDAYLDRFRDLRARAEKAEAERDALRADVGLGVQLNGDLRAEVSRLRAIEAAAKAWADCWARDWSEMWPDYTDDPCVGEVVKAILAGQGPVGEE